MNELKVDVKESSFDNSYCSQYTRRPVVQSLRDVPSVQSVLTPR